MTFATADLYDEHEDKVQVANLLMQSFGRRTRFSGAVSTVRCFEDNSLVRAALQEPGGGCVLVVDGGASVRCALVGDRLAELGMRNGWEGVVVHGCIRDSAVIATLDIGIKALGTHPRRSVKNGAGERDIPLNFADATFTPGDWLYADADGILLSPEKLEEQPVQAAQETGLPLTFVLVHGSMHDGSCWDQVARELNRQGHVAHAPTMAGHGAQAGKFFTQADCVKSVVDFILERGLRDVVLAGHSFAGIVIPHVAEQLSERVNRVVFQNALVLEDGESIYDVITPGHRQMFDAVLKKEGDRSNWMLPFEVFREQFINDADLETASRVYAGLKPVCIYSQGEKISMRGFQRLNVPRSYINFTDDIVLPHGEYAWYPRMAERLGLCRVVQKPGSHEVCYTNPKRLADALIEAGRP